MTKTTNYQLSQWAKSDRIMMDDFNADNQKIDAVLAALKVSVGTYTGTGTSAAQQITLGFQPRAVLVMPGKSGSITYCAGIATPDAPHQYENIDTVVVTPTGFTVTGTANHNNYGTYHYIAIR